jgi:hypothetical protein
MNKILTLRLALASALLTAAPITARHGSNIFVGGMMGAGIGAMAGGRHGVVPGLMTGLAFGTAAEMIDNAACEHDHHCHHHVVYTHEVRPSRHYLEELEEQLEVLEHKLFNEQEKVNYLEHKNAKLEHELAMTEHELEKTNAENHHLRKQLKGNTEIVISAKAVTV